MREHGGRGFPVGEVRHRVFQHQRLRAEEAGEHAELGEGAAEGVADEHVRLGRHGGGDVAEEGVEGEVAVAAGTLAVAAHVGSDHVPAGGGETAAGPGPGAGIGGDAVEGDDGPRRGGVAPAGEVERGDHAPPAA